MDGWVGEWVDGWMGGKANLRNVDYSPKNHFPNLNKGILFIDIP